MKLGGRGIEGNKGGIGEWAIGYIGSHFTIYMYKVLKQLKF